MTSRMWLLTLLLACWTEVSHNKFQGRTPLRESRKDRGNELRISGKWIPTVAWVDFTLCGYPLVHDSLLSWCTIKCCRVLLLSLLIAFRCVSMGSRPYLSCLVSKSTSLGLWICLSYFTACVCVCVWTCFLRTCLFFGGYGMTNIKL